MKKVLILIVIMMFICSEADATVNDSLKARLRAKAQAQGTRLNEQGTLMGIHSSLALGPLASAISIDVGLQMAFYQSLNTCFLLDLSVSSMIGDINGEYESSMAVNLLGLFRIWLTHTNYNDGFHLYFEPGLGIASASGSRIPYSGLTDKSGAGFNFRVFGLGIGYGPITLNLCGSYLVLSKGNTFMPKAGFTYMFKI
jgi:hypothetical protein